MWALDFKGKDDYHDDYDHDDDEHDDDQDDHDDHDHDFKTARDQPFQV